MVRQGPEHRDRDATKDNVCVHRHEAKYSPAAPVTVGIVSSPTPGSCPESRAPETFSNPTNHIYGSTGACIMTWEDNAPPAAWDLRATAPPASILR